MQAIPRPTCISNGSTRQLLSGVIKLQFGNIAVTAIGRKIPYGFLQSLSNDNCELIPLVWRLISNQTHCFPRPVWPNRRNLNASTNGPARTAIGTRKKSRPRQSMTLVGSSRFKRKRDAFITAGYGSSRKKRFTRPC